MNLLSKKNKSRTKNYTLGGVPLRAAFIVSTLRKSIAFFAEKSTINSGKIYFVHFLNMV